jgi:hypothetical protein
MKLRCWNNPATGHEGVRFWCQGCNVSHSLRTVGPAPRWAWNGDMELPVFGPSILSRCDIPDGKREPDDPAAVCHSFVGCNGARPGEIIFLSDSTHGLAGSVQPLLDFPENYG